MYIIIRSQNKEIEITVVPENTIYSIKKFIEEEWNIMVEHQRLYYKFKGLDDNRTIDSYNISDNSIIYFLNKNSIENLLLRDKLRNAMNKYLNMPEQPPNH